MKPHEKRLLEEYEQLTDRIVKLNDFLTTDLYKSLAEDEQTDLSDQLGFMRGYHRTLVRRIKRLEILP